MTAAAADGSAGRRSALYTPEAVRVDLPLADIGSRTLAILIDLFLMASLLYFVLVAALLSLGSSVDDATGGPGWVVVVIILLLNFLVLWGYPVVCETKFRGRTAGKAALGLRVVTTDGAPVRFRHAAIRGLFAFVDFYLFLGIPALVTALVTRKGQRLGDLAAGTVTIRDRPVGGPADQAVVFQVPAGLQDYAGTLDVRGLTTADYALVRRFLLRANSLRPAHRSRLAIDLANHFAGRMHHRPPAGTHPEALLLSIAALLQQRGGTQTTTQRPRPSDALQAQGGQPVPPASAWPHQPDPAAPSGRSGQPWQVPPPPTGDDAAPPGPFAPPG